MPFGDPLGKDGFGEWRTSSVQRSDVHMLFQAISSPLGIPKSVSPWDPNENSEPVSRSVASNSAGKPTAKSSASIGADQLCRYFAVIGAEAKANDADSEQALADGVPKCPKDHGKTAKRGPDVSYSHFFWELMGDRVIGL